jgi:hypothetical protein
LTDFILGFSFFMIKVLIMCFAKQKKKEKKRIRKQHKAIKEKDQKVILI